MNAILAAAGHDLRIILRKLRLLFEHVAVYGSLIQHARIRRQQETPFDELSCSLIDGPYKTCVILVALLERASRI